MYYDKLTEAMALVSQDPNSIFLGQAVGCPGTFMTNTLKFVPESQKMEFPVAESFQMQYSIGLAMSGKLVVSIFPRINFLLLATGDMINYVDKIEELTGLKPHLIIRTAIGPDSPVYPGCQHVGDYTNMFAAGLKNIQIVRLDREEMIVPTYEWASKNKGIYLIVEDGRKI